MSPERCLRRRRQSRWRRRGELTPAAKRARFLRTGTKDSKEQRQPSKASRLGRGKRFGNAVMRAVAAPDPALLSVVGPGATLPLLQPLRGLMKLDSSAPLIGIPVDVRRL